MKKLIASCVFAAIVGVVFAAGSEGKSQKMTPEQVAERVARIKAKKYASLGGIVVKKGSQKGKIAILNAQTKMPRAAIDEVIATLRQETKLNVVCEPCDVAEKPADAFAAHQAGLVLKLIDNAAEPVVLVAPEDRWAVLNVANLGRGLPDNALKDNLFAARCRKEFYRVFSMLCGGIASQFPNNLTWAVKIEDLDLYREFLPNDMPDRYLKYAAALGITPEVRASYKRACQEGWAHQPTNDVEKAIWNKVYELPKNPLKLEK